MAGEDRVGMARCEVREAPQQAAAASLDALLGSMSGTPRDVLYHGQVPEQHCMLVD